MDEALTRIWTDLTGRRMLAALIAVLGILGLLAVAFRQ